MKTTEALSIRENVVTTLDLFSTLCGDLIGDGFSREVYEHRLDKSLVVKIARSAEGVRGNVSEYELWDEIKGLTGKSAWVKDWFAPVVYISPNANVLIMKKTEQKLHKKRPKTVPSFIRDVKTDNFGWIGNKFVCHDYGFIHGFLEYKNKFKEVTWYYESNS